MRTTSPRFPILLLSASLVGCTDPAPDPSKIEEIRSILVESSATDNAPMTGLFQVKLDSPLYCNKPEATSSATVSWNVSSMAISSVEIYVRSAETDRTQSKLWLRGPEVSFGKTPPWVQSGMVFELRNAKTQETIAGETVPCK